MSTRATTFVDAALAACILGVIVCPIPFVILGARDELRPTFYATALPPFLLAGGFLLCRYLARPTEVAVRRLPFLVLEGLAWMVVARFLVLVSGIHLLVGIARFGAVSDSFLAAWLVCLPISIKRRTNLERRLTVVPKAAALVVLVLLLTLASVAALIDFATPTRFPG